MATTDLGIDVECTDDLDPSFLLVSGFDCFTESILHRFQTGRGTLLDDPDYGLDLSSWLNEAMDASSIFALQIAIQNEALKDERVKSVKVEVTFTSALSSLEWSVNGETADGPFSLTFSTDRTGTTLVSSTLWPSLFLN